MFNVLIVDDESALRQGLIQKIEWEALGLVCAGEAEDGLDAMEKIDQLLPDIVLVDIRMPAMDGLALIEHASDRHPNIRWVIVSGYEDFNYAHQALKYGVDDYLLKPVNEEELRKCLEKVTEQLHEERRMHSDREQLDQQFAQALGAHREVVLNRLVGGRTDEETLRELTQYTADSPSKLWAAAVVCIEPFDLPHISFQLGDEPLIQFAMRNIVEERLSGASWKPLVFPYTHDIRLLVVLLPLDREPISSLKPRFQATLSDIRFCLRLGVTAGLGETVSQLEDVHVSFRQAMFAMRTKLLHGAGFVYEYADVREREKRVTIHSIGESEQRFMLGSVQERRREEFEAWLSKRFRRLVDDRHANYAHLERLYLELDTLLRNAASRETNEPEALLDEEGDLMPVLMSFNCWQDTQEDIWRKAERVMSISGSLLQRTGSDIVEEVRKWIESHYQEDITLNWVAERYHIHPNYFSKLFKKENGENFNDYLTRIRLERGAEMLQNPSLKVGWVAEMVGFKDSTYFSSSFKKAFGVTPMQYRNRFKLEE